MPKIKLYHYSNIPRLKKISPKYFGKNSYTDNSGKLSQVKRSYFYITAEAEISLKACQYCYTATINKKSLYDIEADILSLKNGNFDGILRQVKALHYKGIIGAVNKKFKVVCLFNNIKCNGKEL